jgi:hypothetical protein
VSLDPPFFVALALTVASLFPIGLMEVFPDRRLAILAIVMMAVAFGIGCCTVIKV